MRFGTSSPTITDSAVMTMTTTDERDLVAMRREDRDTRRAPVAEPRAERRAAERAGQDADQRDADLDGGQEAAGIFGQRERTGGAARAVLGHLLQPHAPRGDDRHLRQREKSIEQNEPDDDRELEPDAHDRRVHSRAGASRNWQHHRRPQCSERPARPLTGVPPPAQ